MSVTTIEDPLSVFLYALKAPESKRQYPRRLKVFLDYLKLKGSLKQQAFEFLLRAKQNPQWAQSCLMQFITFQKQRADNGEISYSTIGNYYKATKLFCEMNSDSPIVNWKKITRGFITPAAYSALKEWMDYRLEHGETITENSWLMRDLWQTTDMNYGAKFGVATYPKRLKSSDIKSLLERSIKAQGLCKPFPLGRTGGNGKEHMG